MISSELMRRYPSFACLTHDQLVTLANAGEELNIEAGHTFFHEGGGLKRSFFVLEGTIDITIEIPDRNVNQDISAGIMDNFITEDGAVSTVSPGQIFAWSAMISPHIATESATAPVLSRVMTVGCEELMKAFKKDCDFGYLMLQKVAGAVWRSKLPADRPVG